MPNPTPRLLLEPEAVAHVGSPETFRALCDEWGLKPHRKAKGFAFYSLKDIEEALQRRKEPNES